MIIPRIPRRLEDRSLGDFILLQVKKFKDNQRHRYIRLRGEVAYYQSHVYSTFLDYALELVFAISLPVKCENHSILCTLELSKPIKICELLAEIKEAARM